MMADVEFVVQNIEFKSWRARSKSLPFLKQVKVKLLKSVPHFWRRIESSGFFVFGLYIFRNLSVNFTFKSGVCMKSTWTAPDHATYLGFSGFISNLEVSLLAFRALNSMVSIVSKDDFLVKIFFILISTHLAYLWFSWEPKGNQGVSVASQRH